MTGRLPSESAVGTVWGAKGTTFYLLDLVRGRFEFPALRQQVISLAKHWKADITVVEEADMGRALVQDLRRANELSVILQPVRVDKETRILAQSARFEAGKVVVPREAPWLAAWLEELLGFPNASHDDQVDSTSQALNYLTRRMAPLEAIQKPPPRPQSIVRPQSRWS